MTRNPYLIALELVVVSVALSWLWLSHGKYVYAQFFGSVARPFFDLIGQEEILVVSRERFINLVPFLALMVVTPGLSVLRRSLGTLLGLLALFCGHLTLTWMAGITPRASSGGFGFNAFTIRLGAMLFSDSLPFLVWAAIAARQVRGLASWLFPQLVEQETRSEGDERERGAS